MKLAGQRALVTGASKGVGRAIAIALVREGIEVLGTSRDPDSCDWPDGVTPIAFDLSSPATTEVSWQAGGLAAAEISILVNNAGAGVLGEFAATDFDSWQAQVDLMLLAPMKLSQLVMEGWGDSKNGVIVNVSSLAVEYPIPYMSGYNAAKAGLAAFSESLLLEGVRVIDLRLGDLNTAFNKSVLRTSEASRIERVWRAMVKHVDNAPSSSLVGDKLVEVLGKGRSGTVRVGSFFQCVLASFYGRIVWQSARRASNLSYYNLSEKNQ